MVNPVKVPVASDYIPGTPMKINPPVPPPLKAYPLSGFYQASMPPKPRASKPIIAQGALPGTPPSLPPVTAPPPPTGSATQQPPVPPPPGRNPTVPGSSIPPGWGDTTTPVIPPSPFATVFNPTKWN